MTEFPGSSERSEPEPRRRGGPLAPSITVARVRGITVGLHWSWLLIFVLATWSLSTRLFPRTYPGLSDTVYWVMGAAAAIIFFTSILLHELGHAFQALREGMRISDITLWFFGGIARFMGMFPSAGAEFRIAIAGPLVSIALAILFGGLTWVSGAVGISESIRGVLDYLARINAVVVAFNLIPALPLDGGRVLRSWLWSRQGDFTAATFSAAKAARAFAYALVAVGLLGLFTDATTGGVWFVFLGWFLLQAAQAEAGFAAVKQALEDVSVRDLMTRDPVTVPPDMTVEEFIESVVRRHGHSTYPVVQDGRLRGMVSLRLAGAVPYESRGGQRIDQIMMAAEEVPVLEPNQPVLEILETIRSGPGRAVVVEGDQVIGLVSVSDIARALEFQQIRRPERQARPAGVLVWVVVWLVIALALAAFYRPPLAVLAPGPAIDIAADISIKGVPTEKPNGKCLLVAVQISQPTGLGVLYAMFHPDRDIIPRSALIPEGVSEEEEGRRQRAIFDESQTLAAAAAAQAAGLEVSISGRGARVIQVATGAPAQKKLLPGDVITRVNDVEIQIASDLRRTITSLPSGTNFALTVDRDGREVQVQVASARLSGAGGQAAIGVIVDTRDLDIDLPFEIEVKERNIGGPSAGLAYALAIVDLINKEDLLKGRTVAASGTIQIDGEVGAVGGLNQKLEAAEDAKAQIFLVPVEEVRLVQNPDLSVRGVDTLRDALAVLQGS
jgi:PDZ domain-containing secreted protein/Zn-dependent protease/CBS domain-containing protein